MITMLVTNWWLMVLRAAAALLLGMIAVMWPNMSLGRLMEVFAGYTLIDGLLALASALKSSEEGQRFPPLVIEGVTGIATGIAAFSWSSSLDLSPVYLLAAWAFATGILEIIGALTITGSTPADLLLALSGVTSIALSLIVVAVPLTDTITPWLGAYAIVFGALLLVLGFKLQPFVRGSNAAGAHLSDALEPGAHARL